MKRKKSAFPSSLICCWPEGDAPNIQWCGKPVVPTKPYCLNHCKRAYAPVRKREVREPASVPVVTMLHEEIALLVE